MANISDAEMSSLVLCNLFQNAYYASKVLPYLNEDYFSDSTERAIAKTVIEYRSKYNTVPSPKEVVIMMKELNYVNNLDKGVVDDVLGGGYNVQDDQWLIDQTESFIRRRRVSLAFEQTYGDFEGGKPVDGFANVFQEAISFHFDNSIGHDLVADAHIRYDMYISDEERHSLMCEMLDLITDGGVPAGTLNVFLAGTGVGKSFVMAAIAAKAALAGSKVLVISLEMAEIRLAERIEANLMDYPVKKMKKMDRGDFTVRQQQYIKKMSDAGGTIVFKQYPTSSAHAGHFRNLIIEAKNKQNMEFDLIVIDYLNICATSRGSASDNSYTRIKNVAEELRALAIEFQVPIISATQTNKDGQSSSELSIENVSESHGLSATVDLLIGLISHPDWEAVGKLMMMQLKNRYGDTNYYRKFMVGINRAKMQMFDLKREASDEMNKHGKGSTEDSTEPTQALAGIDISVLGNNAKTKVKSGIGNLKT